MRPLLLLALGSMLLGCPEKAKDGAAAASASLAPSSAPAEKAALASASSSAPAAAPLGSGSLAADSGGVLALSWKAVNAASPHVSVSVVVGDQTLAVGPLEATSDDTPSGTVEACSMRNKGATSSMFSCGGVPAYNFYTAKLEGGALVITLTTGVDQEPGSEKVKEVLRRSTSATSLKATGPAFPALYGNCRVGFVQRTADSPCLRKCIKGTECKGADTCKLIDITGTDGPHKVSACIPAGK